MVHAGSGLAGLNKAVMSTEQKTLLQSFGVSGASPKQNWYRGGHCTAYIYSRQTLDLLNPNPKPHLTSCQLIDQSWRSQELIVDGLLMVMSVQVYKAKMGVLDVAVKTINRQHINPELNIAHALRVMQKVRCRLFAITAE